MKKKQNDVVKKTEIILKVGSAIELIHTQLIVVVTGVGYIVLE